MGGHDLDRSSAGYADAARLGWTLGQAHVVATGGGPGAMEAANLGGFLAGSSRGDLANAVGSLGGVPSFRPSVDQWAAKAMTVVHGAGGSRHPRACRRGSTATSRPTSSPPRSRSTSATPPARRSCCRSATPDRVPARRRRHGAGDLPGRLRELLRHRGLGRADGARRPHYWTGTLPAWPLLRSLARGRRWPITSTWSTRSTTPPR